MDEMKNIIKNLIETARECNYAADYDTAFKLAEIAENLIYKMAVTINCPSNWRDIGEELAEEYKDDRWVTKNCKLYEYETIPQF